MRSPRPVPSRLRVTFHLAVTVGIITSLLAVMPGTTAAAGLLEPADGTYEATITRTEYGIPHIEAQDYGSLGFGQKAHTESGIRMRRTKCFSLGI